MSGQHCWEAEVADHPRPIRNKNITEQIRISDEERHHIPSKYPKVGLI
jgi:hypothetical protein